MGRVNEDWLDERKDRGRPTAYSYSYGLPEMNDMTTTEYGPTKDVDVLPRWDVPDEVVIGCAAVGAFISKRQNPNHPTQPDEIRDQIRSAAEAGASYVHVHVRDPETGINTLDADLYHEVLDPVLEDHPDLVVDGTTIPFTEEDWDDVDRIVEDELFDMSPLNPLAGYYGDTVLYEPPDELIERARVLKAGNIKPSVAVSNGGDIHTTKRYLIDTGILDEPYLWNVLPAIPGAAYMPNPTAMAESLTYFVERIREIPGEHEILVSGAGRASSYLATFAMMLGCHVRIGMEDTPYEHPHKDDRIEDNGEDVERFTEIASLLGRERATGDQLRETFGL